MSHDILTNFAKIFQLNSFNNLSNPRNIEVIYQYISYNIPNPDGKEEEYIRTIQEYKKKCGSF